MDFSSKGSESTLLADGIQKIGIVRPGNGYKSFTLALSVVDICLSVFVVTPLIVLSWRGSWGFMDIHLEYFPLFPCFLGGIIIHLILALNQDRLHAVIIQTEQHWSLKIVSHFLRRFYTYLFLMCTVLHWRGGWDLIDYYMNIQVAANHTAKKEGSQWFLIIWVTCFAILVTIKGLRNAIAGPFAICIDKGNYVFRFPITFSRKTKHNPGFLDALFSVGVIGNLVITFWRGMWLVIDILLLPDDFYWSSWISTILGLLLIGVVFRLQNCLKNACARTTGITKVIIADCYIVLSCVATILYWRGIWNLSAMYVLPDNAELSCICCHLVGFVSLVILGCSNSALVRGVYIDGKEEDGECVVFPCQYLRMILEQEDLHNDGEIHEDNNKVTIMKDYNNITV